tara:strand:+ start:461 stop:622 length:162 start_codon:yes stop_codon:yes gene_type:complete
MPFGFEDHLSEWKEVEQERDYYRKQYEMVQKELDEVNIELRKIKDIYFHDPVS